MQNYENNTERVETNNSNFQDGDFTKSFLPNSAIFPEYFDSLKPSESSGSSLQARFPNSLPDFESTKKQSDSLIGEIVANIISEINSFTETVRIFFGLKWFSKKNYDSNFTGENKDDSLIDLNALHTFDLFDHQRIANDNIPDLSQLQRKQRIENKIGKWIKRKSLVNENESVIHSQIKPKTTIQTNAIKDEDELQIIAQEQDIEAIENEKEYAKKSRIFVSSLLKQVSRTSDGAVQNAS